MPSNDSSIHCVFRYKLLVLHSMCVVSSMVDKEIPWGKISQRGIKIASHDRKEKNWLYFLLFVRWIDITANTKIILQLIIYLEINLKYKLRDMFILMM